MKTTEAIMRVELPSTVAYFREHGGAVFGVGGRRTDVSIDEMDTAMRILARLGIDIFKDKHQYYETDKEGNRRMATCQRQRCA